MLLWVNNPQSVADAVRAATTLLGPGMDTARLDAELLMAHALGVGRSELFLRHLDAPEPPEFAALIARRAAHEPVAYILGHQEFFGLPFVVTPDVLIPRFDSELIIETALVVTPNAKRVLDCGTGSGALLLATLEHLAAATGVGIDRSMAALVVAAGNARALQLEGRAEFRRADWTKPDWAAELGQFDLVLANPPYVEVEAELNQSVRDHEPAGALFAGAEGLDDYRVLIPELSALLTPGGVALIEIGYTQAESVSAIAAKAGFTTKLHRDLGDRPRVLELRL